MKRDLLRDVIIAGIENSSESKILKGFCWAGIVLAVVYFGPVCFRILAR
jgi:hypothetical protein